MVSAGIKLDKPVPLPELEQSPEVSARSHGPSSPTPHVCAWAWHVLGWQHVWLYIQAIQLVSK